MAISEDVARFRKRRHAGWKSNAQTIGRRKWRRRINSRGRSGRTRFWSARRRRGCGRRTSPSARARARPGMPIRSARPCIRLRHRPGAARRRTGAGAPSGRHRDDSAQYPPLARRGAGPHLRPSCDVGSERQGRRDRMVREGRRRGLYETDGAARVTLPLVYRPGAQIGPRGVLRRRDPNLSFTSNT